MMAVTRREFLESSMGTLAAGNALQGGMPDDPEKTTVRLKGPGTAYVPRVQAAFVRRAEEYGMRWPGQIYDGVAALENYTRRVRAAGQQLGLDLTLLESPLHSAEEADRWIAQARAQKPDGLLIVLLDRQEHAWPTAVKAVDTGIPTVIYAPVGTAFTTNTVQLAHRTGCCICSTDDFTQAVYGLRMLRAGAKLREMRFIVLQGSERKDVRVNHFGTRLRYIPQGSFLEEYNRTPESEEIRALVDWYVAHATHIEGPSRQDIFNGVRSYITARTFLEREEGDGITMNCLGALGKTTVSLPCISWSLMNDMAIPAACEADLGACISHALVQLLFDRPGFQQDPVPDTSNGMLIGSHCSCATRLHGFGKPPEPFSIAPHHGKRDAVPKTRWMPGQRVTVVCVQLKDPAPEMLISVGAVVDNIAVPPSGGCVVAPRLKLDRVQNYLDYPGFHQLFFYGEYERELKQYCQLFGVKATVI